MTRELLTALGAESPPCQTEDPAIPQSPPCLKGGGAKRRGDIPETDAATPEGVQTTDGIPHPPAAGDPEPFRQGGRQGGSPGQPEGCQPPPGEEADEGEGEPSTEDPEFRTPHSEWPLREHLGRLLAQGEALRREFADFDAAEALRDPDFLRLTAPGAGVDVRRAWLALHPEQLERRAARAANQALARSLASGAARPREGGGASGAALSADYRSLPRAEQQRLKERILLAASRGEKIYP